MAVVVTLAASPSPSSRTSCLVSHVRGGLLARGHDVGHLELRELPAEALLQGRADDPPVRMAVDLVRDADGVVIGTPIYKASYSGLLKVFLDLLPRHALAGKCVLPLATGGSPAHALALAYGLHPVLTAMRARRICPGRFLLDSQFDATEILPEATGPLDRAVAEFDDDLSAVLERLPG
ncbi:NADPH-dependent FMN reductase [Dactylosporangium sp. NBC_01737]|uniref:NADPH-dependent FMN reductase n=1 Tax=Dactylosporangium sp. NBC_01737 TaxID=2975959 RepID=UPI002E161F92|nr:NADPH-dependent FMN reductase [Dactylosporangium sp. NBC_01737]